MFGTLVGVLADNPASCSIGGFKESCSAKRPCHQCKILHSDISVKVCCLTLFFCLYVLVAEIHESQCSLRTPEHYDTCITEMEGTTCSSRRNTLSVECGLNFRSVLNDLMYFHVCSGSLLPDIFHEILEGVFLLEVKLLLKYLIREEQLFTLDQLNSAIENIELGRLDSLDRPSCISYQTLFVDENHSLKQQGKCQAWAKYIGTHLYVSTLKFIFDYLYLTLSL